MLDQCDTVAVSTCCFSIVTLIPVLEVELTAVILSANMSDLLAIFIPACT